MGIQFRKWMIPGWNKRFGSRFGTSFWNERRGFPDEGMYFTTYRFLRDLVVDYRKLNTNYKLHWHSLTERQKANVKRTATEMVFLVTTVLLGYLAKGLAEDDEELKENLMFNVFMYQQDRLWTELSTYHPYYGWFNESKKMLQSPFAVWDVLDDGYKISKDMLFYPFRTEEERAYSSGVRYGQDKVWNQTLRFLPVIRQPERIQSLADNNSFYKLF